MPVLNAPRVCFYARFSLSRNVAASLNYQLEYAKRWCDQHGMRLIDIVVESRLGLKAFERPKFERLMAQARNGAVPFDVLLVHSPCRITRNPERLAFLLKRLERANVQVKMITGEMPAKLA